MLSDVKMLNVSWKIEEQERKYARNRIRRSGSFWSEAGQDGHI